MDKRLRIFATVFLLVFCTIGLTWCGTICAANAVAVASCHHDEPVRVCDDTASVLPELTLIIPSLPVSPTMTSLALAPPAPALAVRVYRVPIAPLRL